MLGIFTISEYWIHAIAVIISASSPSVSLDMNDGEIKSVHRLKKLWPRETSLMSDEFFSLMCFTSTAHTIFPSNREDESSLPHN
ncbi:hypothetical protein Bca101_017249 [Brassica carinata]